MNEHPRLPQRQDGESMSLQPWRAQKDSESGHAYSSFDTLPIWRERLRMVRRHKWWVLAFCALGILVGVWFARREVPMYRATGVLRFESPKEFAGVGQAGAVTPIADQSRLMTELEMLNSRRMAAVLVDSLGLIIEAVPQVRRRISEATVTGEKSVASLDLRFGPAEYVALDDEGEALGRARYGQPLETNGFRIVVDGRPEGVGRARVTVWDARAAADEIQRGLEPRIRAGTQLVDLSFTSPDPDLAARVVNVAARIYQDMNRENASRRAAARVEFVKAQLVRGDSALDQARSDFLRHQQSSGALRSDAELELWHETSMEREAEVMKLASDRHVLASILAGAERSSATEEDLQALVYAPVVSGNETVQLLYARYLEHKEERQGLVSGEWGAAETNPKVERLDRLIRDTRSEIIAAARNLTRIVDQQLEAARQHLSQTQARVGGLPAEAAGEEELSRRVEANQSVVEQLRTELLRAQVDEVLEVGSVEIVDEAPVPRFPEESGRVRKILLGLLLGGLFGIGLVIAIERQNTTVKTRKQAEAILHVPILGVVPHVSMPGNGRLKGWLPAAKGRRNGRPLLVPEGSRAHAPMSEAYRSLRTSLLFSQVVQELRTILITSAKPGEGKTTSAANLAVAFAHQGIKTLLIDAELRNPQIHRLFDIPRIPGLTDLLIGEGAVDGGAYHVKLEHLSVLTSGQDAYNPAELLGSGRFRQLLNAAREDFEVVLIDSPPVLAFTDACVVSTMVDGVIVVVQAGRTDQEQAQIAIR